MQDTLTNKTNGDFHTGNGAEDEFADRLGSLAHDVGSATVENSKAALHDLQVKTEEMTKDITALYEDGEAILRKKVANQPITAITIALAAGALVAGLMFRK